MWMVLILACQLQPDGSDATGGARPAADPHAVSSASVAFPPTGPEPAPRDAAAPDRETTLAEEQDTAAVLVEDTAPVAAEDTAAAAEETASPAEEPEAPEEPEPEPEPEEPEEPEDSGAVALVAAAPFEARLAVDVDDGEFPLVVTFDASASDLGSGVVRYEWSFGDGAVATDAGSAVHTYIGEGEFEATLTLVDESTGQVSEVEVEIDVDTPDCPDEAPFVAVGYVDDDRLDGLSGMVASRLDPDVFWVHEDGDSDELVAIDRLGITLSEHDLPNDFEDFEDLESAVDPVTGVSTLFLGDFGDNDLVRGEVAVWVVDEPDPYSDSDLDPLRMELTYPGGPVDAETLLVDPLTLDLYIVTKTSAVDQTVYRKRAPHDDEGPFELEDLGTWPELDFTPTGGDVSADGLRVVVRGYSSNARMWFRDGYRSFQEVFDDDPCEIEIATEPQGEAIGFTGDGAGLATVSEGEGMPIYYIGL